MHVPQQRNRLQKKSIDSMDNMDNILNHMLETGDGFVEQTMAKARSLIAYLYLGRPLQELPRQLSRQHKRTLKHLSCINLPLLSHVCPVLLQN